MMTTTQMELAIVSLRHLGQEGDEETIISQEPFRGVLPNSAPMNSNRVESIHPCLKAPCLSADSTAGPRVGLSLRILLTRPS